MADQSPQRSTILVVDDDPSNRSLLTIFLRLSFGSYEIVTAMDGHEALEYVSALPVVLIITDNQMPLLSGLELTSIIKAQQPKIGVILMSADIASNIERLAAAHGADYYLAKPFSLDQLKQIVEMMLEPTLQERVVSQSL